MTIGPIRGFFAYPSTPASAGDAILAAVKRLNAANEVSITPWSSLRVAGTILIDTILREIDRSDLFCVDLTGLNPNVMFELGYAISKDKRVWPIQDTGFTQHRRMFDEFRILSTLGYAKYSNSVDIENNFYSDRAYEDLTQTIFRNQIKPQLKPVSHNTLFYLKSLQSNEASVRIQSVLENSASLQRIVDDPAESSFPPLSWYAQQTYAAIGVVCHLQSPEREGSPLANARSALISGIAHGLGRPLLMLVEGQSQTPLDYRDLAFNYKNAQEAAEKLKQWVEPLANQARSVDASLRLNRGKVLLQTELHDFEIGEFIAENEVKGLRKYFVETTAYREALRGVHTIFVGRKGTGKSANFYSLQEHFTADPETQVCTVKPVAFDMLGIVRLLASFKARDEKGYVIESLWKYIIYTELLRSAVIENEHSVSPPAYVSEIHNKYSFVLEPLSIRLEKAVESITAANFIETRSVESERIHLAISEGLHKGALKNIRKPLELARISHQISDCFLLEG
jgi:hypothetical protein